LLFANSFPANDARAPADGAEEFGNESVVLTSAVPVSA
jgi:hypothetical protein